MINLTCHQCQASFSRRQRPRSAKTFCTRHCSALFLTKINKTPKKPYLRTPNTKCLACEKPIYRRPKNIKSGPVFCSLQCNGASLRKPDVICSVCEAVITIKRGTIGRNRKCCSRACSNKARTGIKYFQGSPNDKAKKNQNIKAELMKLRGACCENCKHSNHAILHVHHIKERSHGGTDELDNLLLLCPNCHGEVHLGYQTFDEFKLS